MKVFFCDCDLGCIGGEKSWEMSVQVTLIVVVWRRLKNLLCKRNRQLIFRLRCRDSFALTFCTVLFNKKWEWFADNRNSIVFNGKICHEVPVKCISRIQSTGNYQQRHAFWEKFLSQKASLMLCNLGCTNVVTNRRKHAVLFGHLWRYLSNPRFPNPRKQLEWMSEVAGTKKKKGYIITLWSEKNK